MRELDIGTKRFTEVVVADKPGEGGACHKYFLGRAERKTGVPVGEFGFVRFQTGPIKERGINGCHNEDLLAIVIDRLQHFQAGVFNCKENALALDRVQSALHWLDCRTFDRGERGVKGTNQL